MYQHMFFRTRNVVILIQVSSGDPRMRIVIRLKNSPIERLLVASFTLLTTILPPFVDYYLGEDVHYLQQPKQFHVDRRRREFEKMDEHQINQIESESTTDVQLSSGPHLQERSWHLRSVLVFVKGNPAQQRLLVTLGKDIIESRGCLEYHCCPKCLALLLMLQFDCPGRYEGCLPRLWLSHPSCFGACPCRSLATVPECCCPGHANHTCCSL